MEAKCYRAMQWAQSKMLREYFFGVLVKSLTKRSTDIVKARLRVWLT